MTAYYYIDRSRMAALYKDEILFRRTYPDSALSSQLVDIQGESQLISGYDFYARQREYLLVGIVAIYLLNVAEAMVDGHFVTFDVSPDLSLNLRPTLSPHHDPLLSLALKF